MCNKPLYKENNFKRVSTLHLMLGNACNMNCRHCCQVPSKNHVLNLHPNIEDKVWTLIENFIAYSINNPLPKGHREIFLWGGEALVYWDLVKEIVLRMAKKFNFIDGKGFKFSIFTNGSLLTEDKIDFINKFDIYCIMSYDAPYPWAVRGYVSDEICRLTKKIKHCSIVSNSCSYNVDLFLTRKCLKAKFPHIKKFGLGRYGFVVSRVFDIPSDIYTYDWDKVKYALKRMRIAVQLGDKDAIDVLDGAVFYWLRLVTRKNFPKEWIPACIMGHILLAVTLDGNVPICHNTNIMIGSVEDSLENIYNKAFTYMQNHKNPECIHCRHIDVCDGICPLEIRDSSGNACSCKDFRKPFYDLFKTEMVKLNLPLSEEDALWYKEQEKVMQKQIQDFLNEGNRYKKERTALPQGL